MQKKGSKSIPQVAIEAVERRLTSHITQRSQSQVAIALRSRGEFIYVDAKGHDVEQFEPLLRLRYIGDSDRWEFGYYTWAKERYESSFLANGSPFGTPEECYDAASFSLFPDS